MQLLQFFFPINTKVLSELNDRQFVIRTFFSSNVLFFRFAMFSPADDNSKNGRESNWHFIILVLVSVYVKPWGIALHQQYAFHQLQLRMAVFSTEIPQSVFFSGHLLDDTGCLHSPTCKFLHFLRLQQLSHIV